jgi:hypothetical protein
MRIAIVTQWYNEELLAPIFFDHYKFVDKIYIFLDSSSTEESKDVLYSYALRLDNLIAIIPFDSIDGIDDISAIQRINQFISKLDYDWIFNIDFDEFAFALPAPLTIREFLQDEAADVVYVWLWQVYRHITDEDLDFNKGIEQRLHGDYDFYDRPINRMYIKPVVVRPQKNIVWRPGKHTLVDKKIYKISQHLLFGAHWAMADPLLAIERRLYNRTNRISKQNYRYNLGAHLFNLTKDSLLKECEDHLNDPQLFSFDILEDRTKDKVSIVVPYIRKSGVERCINAIRENVGIPDSQYEIVAEEDAERIGVTKKLKELVAKTKYDVVMFLGDDTVPQKDFLKNALYWRELLVDKWGLVGLNDNFCNSYMCATHWMADKKLLDCLDGEFFHTGYSHCYADQELTIRCAQLGKYIFAVTSKIEHENPIVKNDMKLLDDDYRRVYSSQVKLKDANLFAIRKRNNWKNRKEINEVR